jgi:thiamine-triphosphatase
MAGLRQCVLEVERKFRTLAVRELTQHAGTPPFKSLHRLPAQTIRDAYFDTPSRLLSTTGAWIRRRNGEWEAKIKQGGTFNKSRFEEITGVDAVAACVARITGGGGVRNVDNFGLETMASFVTSRETWVADDEFHVVLDTMDFGHEVGEVELQRELALGGQPDEAQDRDKKQRAMQEMDESISTFMRHYAWAFTPGEPVGKLTAYFTKVRSYN